MSVKYFLYARKSTDEDDRQILSIEAQMAELKEFAAKEKLEIVASFEEAKTAKEPGRTKFGEMLDRIGRGEAHGILAWHPDRLARNPIDGGQVIYMVDTKKIHSLKFPTFWFEDTPQGKFMLNIAFGQSKYFIDNLSENVKRGLRQKLRRGEWPGWAPVGYLNDMRNHTIIVDPVKHALVKRMFDLYASGDYGLKELGETMNELNLKSQRNNRMSASMVYHILQNPFYCGVFRHKGEMYQGNHEPIITKKLFDQAQEMLKHRGRPHKRKKHEYIFTALMKCGKCDCYITAERQKGHIYYRCSKKKGVCDEKYVREEKLLEDMKTILQKVSLPDDWTDRMLAKMDGERQTEAQSSVALVQSLQGQIQALESRLDKLLDGHLEGTIDKASYLRKKEVFLNEKLSLEEKRRELLNKGADRLEPMREFILESNRAKKVADEGDLIRIRAFLQKVGSNFTVEGKKLQYLAKRGWRIVGEIAGNSDWLPRLDSNQEPTR